VEDLAPAPAPAAGLVLCSLRVLFILVVVAPLGCVWSLVGGCCRRSDECPPLASLLRQRSPCCCQKIKCRVLFPPLLPFPPKASSPWTALDVSMWAWMCWKCHHLLLGRSPCPAILGLRARHHSSMVYHMPSVVPTAAAIPLHGFLPVDGAGWWYVGSDVLEVITSCEDWWRVLWS
jgi:hypothetical protein